MRIKTLFITTVLFSALGASADFRHYADVPNDALVKHDFSNPSRIFVLESSGQASFIYEPNGAITQISIPYRFRDPVCDLNHLKAMTFAFPYFVSAGTVCKINASTLTIDSIISEPMPEVFAVMYFGESEETIYFLMNGKPFDEHGIPLPGPGFLKMRIIEKNSNETRISTISNDVPGFSGAMWSDESDFLMTIWDNGQNMVHKLTQDRVLIPLFNGAPLEFGQLSTPLTQSPFEGLSLSLFANPTDFIYDNRGESGSYQIDRATGTRTVISIPDECNVISPAGSEWLLRCGAEVKKGTF